MTDATKQLSDDTRVLLTALTILPDQRTQITNLTSQIRRLTDEQALAVDGAEAAETAMHILRNELAAARSHASH